MICDSQPNYESFEAGKCITFLNANGVGAHYAPLPDASKQPRDRSRSPVPMAAVVVPVAPVYIAPPVSHDAEVQTKQQYNANIICNSICRIYFHC